MSKYKIEDLQQEALDNHFILVSMEYKNLELELHYQCPKGHNIFIPYKKMRKKYLCPICDKFNGSTEMSISAEVIIKPNSTYRILSFDQSSKISGYAIFDNHTLIKYGAQTITGKDAPTRFIKVRDWFVCMIEAWKPDLVILEDIQMQTDEADGTKGITTFKILAELLGVLETYLVEMELDYQLANIATWRSVEQIDGKTREEKKSNAKIRVKQCYDIDVTDDIADAILIGRYAIHKHDNTIDENNIVRWE